MDYFFFFLGPQHNIVRQVSQVLPAGTQQTHVLPTPTVTNLSHVLSTGQTSGLISQQLTPTGITVKQIQPPSVAVQQAVQQVQAQAQHQAQQRPLMASGILAGTLQE